MTDELIDIFNEYGFTILFFDDQNQSESDYSTCQLSKAYGERLYKELLCFQIINSDEAQEICEHIDTIANNIQSRIVLFEKMNEHIK